MDTVTIRIETVGTFTADMEQVLERCEVMPKARLVSVVHAAMGGTTRYWSSWPLWTLAVLACSLDRPGSVLHRRAAYDAGQITLGELHDGI